MYIVIFFTFKLSERVIIKLACVGFMHMQALTFYNLKNLNVNNLRVRNAQQIQISIEKCNNVNVKNAAIAAPDDSPNTDGIHITNTQNIQVSKSFIGTG